MTVTAGCNNYPNGVSIRRLNPETPFLVFDIGNRFFLVYLPLASYVATNMSNVLVRFCSITLVDAFYLAGLRQRGFDHV
jgi:hypothetical protein